MRNSCRCSSDGRSSRPRTASRTARHRGPTTSRASRSSEDDDASLTRRSSSSTRSPKRDDDTAERSCSSADRRCARRSATVAAPPPLSCSGRPRAAAVTRDESTSTSRTMPRHSPTHPSSPLSDGNGSTCPSSTRTFDRRRRTDVRPRWTARGSCAPAPCNARNASTEGMNERSTASRTATVTVGWRLIGVRPAGDPSAPRNVYLTEPDVTAGSCVFQDHGLHDVRDVLEPVQSLLERLRDVFPSQDVHRTVIAPEHVGDRPAVDTVALVLQRIDLDPVRLQDAPVEPVEDLEGGLGLRRRAHEHIRLLDHEWPRLLDAVQHEQVACRFDRVDHVVERRRELVDVLAVHRRDERRVQMLDHLVRDLVPFMLALLQPARLDLDVGEVRDEVVEELRGDPQVLRTGGEQLEEGVGSVRDLELHRGPPRERRRTRRAYPTSSIANRTNQNNASPARNTLTHRNFSGVGSYRRSMAATITRKNHVRRDSDLM